MRSEGMRYALFACLFAVGCGGGDDDDGVVPIDSAMSDGVPTTDGPQQVIDGPVPIDGPPGVFTLTSTVSTTEHRSIPASSNGPCA